MRCVALSVLAVLGLPEAAAQTSYPSAGGPVPIPDGTPGGVTSTIVVPAGAPPVADLDVSLDISHTWVGDLVVTLAREATLVTLVRRNGVFDPRVSGCSGDDLAVVADDQGTAGPLNGTCLATAGQAYVRGGRYRPQSPLSVFTGTPGAGTYRLTVADEALGDTGTLNAWALVFSGAVGAEGAPAAGASRLSVAPNPVSGEGRIALAVATAQHVRVALHDALGREVRVLLERPMAAGSEAFIAFATAGLPAGVYVVRATGDDLNLTRRVTVGR